MTYVSLGKFDNALHELLYTLTCSWDWGHDHDGNVDGFGAYAWPLKLEREDLHEGQLAELADEAKRIDPDDTELPNQVFGYWLVSTDERGFVYVTKFDEEWQLDTAWEAFKDSYSQWAEENEDD